MRRASLVFVLAVLLLSACSGNDTAEPQVQERTETSVADTVPSSKKAIIPPGFPRTIGVEGEVLAALLTSSFSVVDPTVRSFLTRAREPFRITLTDGEHVFSPRLKSMGLLRAEIRREMVMKGNVMGEEASEIIALVQYFGSDELMATEILVFSLEESVIRHVASYVLGQSVVYKITIANRAIRVRADTRLPGQSETRLTDMTFTPEER